MGRHAINTNSYNTSNNKNNNHSIVVAEILAERTVVHNFITIILGIFGHLPFTVSGSSGV